MRGTMQAVPRLALLLYAISPVTEPAKLSQKANINVSIIHLKTSNKKVKTVSKFEQYKDKP